MEKFVSAGGGTCDENGFLSDGAAAPQIDERKGNRIMESDTLISRVRESDESFVTIYSLVDCVPAMQDNEYGISEHQSLNLNFASAKRSLVSSGHKLNIFREC